ncbi:DMT family transporter [Nocardia tengchongensis]|uniref:DMT family transporter n=1 Tax=Nocardia tengchongensis TaxID=2055889 RepID=UPI00367C091A
MVWILLGAAILAEVAATTSLQVSDGLSRVWPTVVVVVGYSAAFILLSQVLKRGMNLGVAYSVWVAVGVALVALIGAMFLGGGFTWIQVCGLVLVTAGVVVIKLGAAR